MTAETPPQPPADTPRRCQECDATTENGPPTPPSPGVEGDAIPTGTHCEWCGAEFPDE